MSKPILTQKRLKELLHYNESTGLFTWIETASNRAVKGSIAGSERADGYRSIRIDKSRWYAHRLAWLYVNGELPENEIDHIDHNPRNNSIENLRHVSHSTNHRNRSKNTGTKCTGVHWCKTTSRWVAKIFNKKQIHLGNFVNFTDAVLARKTAETTLGFHKNHGG